MFPMHRAAIRFDPERVRQLIEGGACVDGRDNKGHTPLHWAAKVGSYEVAELLIRSKCDLNLKDLGGRTPVLLAAIHYNERVVDLLLRHGAQVDCADYDNCTLLHYASSYGWTGIARLILDREEADPDAATVILGYTPLMWAAQRGDEDIASLLLRAGADANLKNSQNMTALHQAALFRRTQVAQVLLEVEGLDINCQDKQGKTPLHRARNREVLTQLLEAGAGTAIKNDEGETALSEGIRRGEFTLEGIRLLVQHGAFLQECDYVRISQNPVLKERVLKDVGLCTQSIVNKFHRQSLPALDSISYFARKLPRVDNFKLNARQIDEVEGLVKEEIERKGFCNVVKAHPMALSALCVLSLITCQSDMELSASPELAIHKAAKKGDLERVRRLIKGGASVDSRDDQGRTPLHLAAQEGWYEVVELLTSSNCDLNLKDHLGFTPVLVAAYEENETVVHLLLRRGAQVNCADDHKDTLLHHVSFHGWTNLVRLILDKGEADPDAAERCGHTPLMWAAHMGYEDITALFVRAGADVNQSNVRKETALHLAADNCCTRVVRVLLQEEGLNLNPQNVYGETPLHYASTWGYREIIEQLLVAGADTTLMNNKGETALSKGIKREELNVEDIGLFVQHGAFLQECDYGHISQNPVLKESVLKDVGICTQSIVNKFHRQSLPTLDSISYFARKLPNIDTFKLKALQIDEVENLVKGEIERKGFCNVVKAHPMALSALCVLSLIT